MARFNVKEWTIVGVVFGILTPIILWLSQKLPTLQLTFSTISLNIREKVTQNLITGQVADFIKSYLGISITLPGIIMGAISGIVLILAARAIISIPQLKFLEAKNKLLRLMTVVFLALVLQMAILAGLKVPTFSAIFGYIISAVAVSLIVAYVVYPYVLKKKQLPE